MTSHLQNTDPELERTRLFVTLAIALPSLLLAGYWYLAEHSLLDATAAITILLAALSGQFMASTGRSRYAAHVVTAGVMVASVLSIIAFGSIQGGGTLLFVGAVVGAGIFTGKKTTMAVTLAAIGSIIALGWAEWQGWIVQRRMFGGTVLLTYVAIVAAISLMVHYSRRRTQLIVRQLKNELETRTRTERERDRSLDRFARIFRSSPNPMLAQSARDGTILDVNPAFERCYGYTHDQIVGRQDTLLWADPDLRSNYLKELTRLRRTDRVTGQSLRADGSRFDVLVSSEMSDQPGDRLVITSIVDVSKEKQHEALLISLASGAVGETGENLLRRLCEHMASSLGADLTAVAERRDDNWMQTLAVRSEGQPVQNHAYALAGTPCEQTMATQGPCEYPADVDLQFPDFQTLASQGYKAYAGQRLLDADGHPIGLIHALWRHPIQLDTPSRALLTIYASRANAELMRMRRDREIAHLNATLDLRVRERTAELQNLNAELDSFAYSVSHDLKSPLRAIDGFTQLLQESLEGRLQERERQIFQRVLAATHRMAKLIADLLALTRVSQGLLHRQRVDLGAMAQDILQAEQQRQPQRRLRWRLGTDLQVQADPLLMRIALSNLLSNAIKYTRDQADPLIEFDRVAEADGQPGEFVLRDNGAGFDMVHADKLFKPFQRLHMPSSGYEGTGIGLATVRRIIERHGGHIHGRGQPGLGAEFRFSLTSQHELPTASASHLNHDS